MTWTPTSGLGKLHSWTVVHHSFLPAFAAALPYTAGLVALDEDDGLRLAARLLAHPEDLAIDLPVEVVFRPLRFLNVEGEVIAPFFRPRPEIHCHPSPESSPAHPGS